MQKYICPCLTWAAAILVVILGVTIVLALVTESGVWQ